MVNIAKHQVIFSKFANVSDIVLGMHEGNWLAHVFSRSEVNNVNCRGIATEKQTMVVKLATTHWCTYSRYLSNWPLLY